jgi:serine/threonine kinase 16
VGVDLDEKVDVWSLGCTLFALAYGTSPFEANPAEAGGSLAMAVLNGAWKFPANDKIYSQGLRDLISFMLVVEPSQRPDIHKVCLSRRKGSKLSLIENKTGHRGH